MSEQWLTYPQLAEHWQMSAEAARTRARRGRYQRRVSNVGQAEVLVDVSGPIPKARRPRSEGQTRTPTPSDTPSMETPPAATVKLLEALEAHVTTLKDQLAKADALVDQLRQERDAERDRATDLMAQLLKLTGEMLEAKKAEQAPPRRSWWQRLAG